MSPHKLLTAFALLFSASFETSTAFAQSSTTSWGCLDAMGMCYFAGTTTSGNDQPVSAANPQNAPRPQCAIDYYGAPWCGPCRNFKPIVQNLATQFVTTLREYNVDQPNPLNYQGLIPFVKLWQWDSAARVWNLKWSGTGAMNQGTLQNALWANCAPLVLAPMPTATATPTPIPVPIPSPIMPAATATPIATIPPPFPAMPAN